MSNSVFLLASQPPAEPDTFVVMGAFRGAGAALAAAPYTGAAPAPGDYLVLNQAAATAVEVIALPAAAAGDRIALLLEDLGPGITVTGADLSRSLTPFDKIVNFEFDGASWVEV